MIQQIKDRIKVAMKEKNDVEKSILRVVLGECQTLEARQGSISEDQVIGIVRKLIEKNKETLQAGGKQVLADENAILESLLPKTLSREEISLSLRSKIWPEIVAAKSDGQATGLAMKWLKEKNAPVIGGDVAEVVKQLRLAKPEDVIINEASNDKH